VKQKPLLGAKLRKVQADLESFAFQTNDQSAKEMYYNQSKELQNLIQKINPFLKE
jgi:ribosomal protein S17E